MATSYTFGKCPLIWRQMTLLSRHRTLIANLDHHVGAPVAPDPVRWVSYEVGRINIEWTTVPEAVAYQIQYTDMVSFPHFYTAKML
jgi:hypothetical protein